MALSSGVYSLIGVGVGTIATGGLQWGLAVRAERRQVRAARRVLTLTLGNAVGVHDRLMAAAESGDYPENLDSLIDVLAVADATWKQHSETLAKERRHDWMPVATAFMVVDRDIAHFSRDSRSPPHERLVEGSHKALMEGLRALDDAAARAREKYDQSKSARA